MKHIGFTAFVKTVAWMAACTLLLPMGIFPSVAQETESKGYYTVFSDAATVAECYSIYNVNLTCEDGAMKVNFMDNTGKGNCFDPYFSFRLPSNQIDCEQNPFFAILLKTNKQDKQFQIRFMTDKTTGQDYPTRYITLMNTDDWQLIAFRLTDTSRLAFTSASKHTGVYTNLRIDVFENECPVDTEFYIKGFGLFATQEEAEGLPSLIDAYEQAQKEKKEQQKADLSQYWRGEAFCEPASAMRMRWLSYGFQRATYQNDINRFLLQGYGGIVSNVNFNAQYLRDSDEFKLLADVYTLAHEKGLKTWIYDEYQWPSGKAFGQVLDGHDEYQATGIQMLTVTGTGQVSFTLPADYLKIMSAELTDQDGTRTPTFTETGITADANGKWTLHVYALRYTYEGTEDRTNFDTLRDVDLLNPDAVKRFIELTYVRYRDEMGEAFRLVEAFFTDEPQLGNRGYANYAVWTEKLPEKFKEKYGYDLEIKYIFSGDTAEARVQRQNYYALVAELFTEAYTKQIAAWCEANGTAGSGHLLFEENMNDHVETYGGGFLQLVGAMTVPGSDSLWTVPDDMLNGNAYVGNYMGLKYVGSAAKNAGKKDVMVEFSPAVCDNETFSKDVVYYSKGGTALMRMMGANIFNVINPQASYSSEQINTVNEYVGRMNTVLEGSVSSTELAVYYPIETIQAYHDAGSVHSSEQGTGQTESERLNSKYQSLCLSLLQAKADYTVIDAESILASRITADGYMLIGDGAYKTVTLGYVQYINPTVLDKLVTFTRAGGRVIFVGDTPQYATVRGQDAQVEADMNQLADCKRYTSGSSTAVKEISASVAHTIKVDQLTDRQHANLFIADYELPEKDVTFAVNLLKQTTAMTVTFTDGYSGAYTVYFPATGKIVSCTGSTGIEIPSYECCLIVRDADNTHTYTDYVEIETEPATETETETASDAETGTDSQSVTDMSETDGTNLPAGGCTSSVATACAFTAVAAAVILHKKKHW